ncbi:hypothetical protein COCSUDRAFT_56406 [Coccomyxa subellipsoidea C-169]|uniref:Enkurin domain-containing protein n=1 Tax=Coccomyxa subellipsoidea (strain C-169) TaxID=574566 RepID=I0YU94_COCSC|nr:hypothetical protein COCSUDRAFT_56406 [Coccomyxa subellipsoidea C-169]EIE21963.1 hypothetical protein COCSUDRAFT_56406 [Coccomyxa subellipsoidea C-169]|eukprot:XP_005646507.1 hypothetical protein COCSUDRAFT_56406 [Coccomyxa subellipsoidea C-169]
MEVVEPGSLDAEVRRQRGRQGIKPVNHAQNNVAAIQAQSDRIRTLKKQQEEAAEAAQRSRPTSAASVRSSGYASPHYTPRRASLGAKQSDAQSEFGRSSSQAPAPFVPVVRARPTRDDGDAWLKKDDYGCVPQYLIHRQLEMAAAYAEEQAEREAAKIPDGMRLLPEEERLEMLSLLEASRDELEAKIRALPFITETVSQKKYKAGLEARLTEVEAAMEAFEQPHVLVPM